MVVQELCRKLPAIDYNNGALLLAVGTPPAPAAADSGSASPAPSSPHAAASSATFRAAPACGGRQAATLYDMQSGTPKFHLLTEAHAARGLDPISDPGGGGAAAVLALAFDAEGERMAAMSLGGGGGGFASPRGGGGGVLRVWSLDLGFSQRLQQLRGLVSLEPVFCKSVSGYMQNAMSRDTCAPLRVTVHLMSSAFVLLPMSTASFFYVATAGPLVRARAGVLAEHGNCAKRRHRLGIHRELGAGRPHRRHACRRIPGHGGVLRSEAMLCQI